MARTRTLANLREDVRKRADIEAATARFPDAEINEYINQSIARLYTWLDRLDGLAYAIGTQSITTVAGTSTYALDSEVWLVKRVQYIPSSGNAVLMRKFMQSEAPFLMNSRGWNTIHPIYYRLISASQIQFLPIPAAAHTVQVIYTPAPTRLSNDASTFDGLAGFEEWVVLDAAIRCKQKDSLDPSLLVAERAEIEAWIAVMADRDAAEPDRVQDLQDYVNVVWW